MVSIFIGNCTSSVVIADDRSNVNDPDEVFEDNQIIHFRSLTLPLKMMQMAFVLLSTADMPCPISSRLPQEPTAFRAQFHPGLPAESL